jgi:FkbM family methyltransferase
VVERYYAEFLGANTTLRGVKLDLSTVSPHIMIDVNKGRHESEEAAAIAAFLTERPELDILELGGFLGYISCFIENVSSSTRHIVVEPNPEMAPVLERNRQLNNSTFDIVHAAYASQAETVTLHVPDNERAASLYGSSDESYEVPGVSIAQLIDRFSLSDFALVVDIEGGEIDLLTNELDLLENHCDLLIIEFHDDQVDGELKDRINDAARRLEASSFKKAESFGNVSVFEIPPEE